MSETLYDDEVCECCYNEISGDEAEAYGGLCKKCYQNNEVCEEQKMLSNFILEVEEII